MTELWIGFAVIVAAGVFWFGFRGSRNRVRAPQFENEREAALTKRVASNANCSLSLALVSVRQELGFSPQQTDDVLVKRAVYHYQQANPTEHRVTYCDPVRG